MDSRVIACDRGDGECHGGMCGEPILKDLLRPLSAFVELYFILFK